LRSQSHLGGGGLLYCMLALFLQEFYTCLIMAFIKVETCRTIIYSSAILNIFVIAPFPLLFRLLVTFNCHLLSAHAVGRFLRIYGDCAVMHTVKIAYSLPNGELVKTGNSKQQSLSPRAFRHHSNENAFWSYLNFTP
jgi:hypothetical protein